MGNRPCNLTCALDTSACIKCGACTRVCLFLQKYDMDLDVFAKKPEVSYGCFLCQKCSNVCPVNIRGEQIAVAHRASLVDKNNGKVPAKGYGLTIWEKNDYKYKSYKLVKSESVIMPGCNFSAFYPRTTEKLEQIALDNNMGVLYECCAKPVYELGMVDKALSNLRKVEERLKSAGVEEIVCVCPNCYHFLQGKIDIKLTTIYEKLESLGIGKCIEAEKIDMFFPCPDAKNKEMEKHIELYLGSKPVNHYRGCQCCGLGGCACVSEPELAQEMLRRAKDKTGNMLLTYCASCISAFRRSGLQNCGHVLPLILGVEDEFPKGLQSVWNRVKHKF